MNDAAKNVDRFIGFADIYENARPSMPLYPVTVISSYLGRSPKVVVDLGCGTGLSTMIWKDCCEKVIGIEPSEDMLSVAYKKQDEKISFIKAYSHETGLPDESADAIVCSQSFHWMEPFSTLAEINRILKSRGVFAAVDCDWPPLCNWTAEKAYCDLFDEVFKIEQSNSQIRNSFQRWDKNRHLTNMKASGYFRFVREIVFSNSEKCNAGRFINLALSQGGVQSIMKVKPELILSQIEDFKKKITAIFGDKTFDISFCYRMRIGVK